ncbi:MAG: hypothetical protein V3T31_08085 [candidate division Zixibacteria bacterium]
MTVLWQQIVVWGVLLVAGVYLAIHFYRQRKVEMGCKSCPALEAMTKKSSSTKKPSSI